MITDHIKRINTRSPEWFNTSNGLHLVKFLKPLEWKAAQALIDLNEAVRFHIEDNQTMLIIKEDIT